MHDVQVSVERCLLLLRKCCVPRCFTIELHLRSSCNVRSQLTLLVDHNQGSESTDRTTRMVYSFVEILLVLYTVPRNYEMLLGVKTCCVWVSFGVDFGHSPTLPSNHDLPISFHPLLFQKPVMFCLMTPVVLTNNRGNNSYSVALESYRWPSMTTLSYASPILRKSKREQWWINDQ